MGCPVASAERSRRRSGCREGRSPDAPGSRPASTRHSPRSPTAGCAPLVRLRPSHADNVGQQPLHEGVATIDCVGQGSAARAQTEVVLVTLCRQALAPQPANHLRRCLRADVQPPSQGRDVRALVAGDQVAQGDQVLLRSLGGVRGPMSRHVPRIVRATPLVIVVAREHAWYDARALRGAAGRASRGPRYEGV